MSTNVKTNIPKMVVNDVIDLMMSMYRHPINKMEGFSIKNTPSVMLWGAPGVGKSQAVRALANRITKETNKKVNVTDVRLLLFNPVDLRGIPTSDVNKQFSIWLKPKIFDMDESDDVVNILFLDEITAAPQSVQAAAYQITLDRIIGEHKIPDNCIIIAAGNRITDKSVAYKMPKALGNRLIHFEVYCTIDDWKKWALKNNIDSRIIGFLTQHGDNKLMDFDTQNDDVAYPTPRSWEAVDKIIKLFDGNINAAENLIAGAIGSGAMIEFTAWTQVYDKIPNIMDIFEGKCKQDLKKESPDVNFAVYSSIVNYVSTKFSDDKKAIGNVFTYIMKNMTPEFQVLIVKDIKNSNPNAISVLLKIPECSEWLNKNEDLLSI